MRLFFYFEDRERTLDSPIEKVMLSIRTITDEMEREATLGCPIEDRRTLDEREGDLRFPVIAKYLKLWERAVEAAIFTSEARVQARRGAR